MIAGRLKPAFWAVSGFLAAFLAGRKISGLLLTEPDPVPIRSPSKLSGDLNDRPELLTPPRGASSLSKIVVPDRRQLVPVPAELSDYQRLVLEYPRETLATTSAARDLMMGHMKQASGCLSKLPDARTIFRLVFEIHSHGTWAAVQNARLVVQEGAALSDDFVHCVERAAFGSFPIRPRAGERFLSETLYDADISSFTLPERPTVDSR